MRRRSLANELCSPHSSLQPLLSCPRCHNPHNRCRGTTLQLVAAPKAAAAVAPKPAAAVVAKAAAVVPPKAAAVTVHIDDIDVRPACGVGGAVGGEA